MATLSTASPWRAVYVCERPRAQAGRGSGSLGNPTSLLHSSRRTVRRGSPESAPTWFGLYYLRKAVQMPLQVRCELELWLPDSTWERLLEPPLSQLRNRDTNALQNCSDQCFSRLAATGVTWGARETAMPALPTGFTVPGCSLGSRVFQTSPAEPSVKVGVGPAPDLPG